MKCKVYQHLDAHKFIIGCILLCKVTNLAFFYCILHLTVGEFTDVLSFLQCKEADLKAHFEKFGDVSEVTIPLKNGMLLHYLN